MHLHEGEPPDPSDAAMLRILWVGSLGPHW